MLTAAATGYHLAGHSISRPVLLVAALAVALVLIVPRPIWRWARLGVTAVHESGHAVMALLVGRRVTAIHLRPDSSGVTIHYGHGGTVRKALTASAGYPAPGILGLAGAVLLDLREPRIWLVALLALGVVNVVLWIRNLFGFVVMAGWIGALGWLIARGTVGVDALVSAAAVWFLVVGGLRAAAEMPRGPVAGLKGRPGPSPSDAVDVGRLLHLPAGLCKVGFIVVGAAAVAASAKVLSAAAFR
jgi:hypothetical protein